MEFSISDIISILTASRQQKIIQNQEKKHKYKSSNPSLSRDPFASTSSVSKTFNDKTGISKGSESSSGGE